jgi:hypothetical protein
LLAESQKAHKALRWLNWFSKVLFSLRRLATRTKGQVNEKRAKISATGGVKMLRDIVERWYEKWSDLVGLLGYSGLMFFIIDYWLQILPVKNFTLEYRPDTFFRYLPRQIIYFLIFSFLVCIFLDRKIQKKIYTLFFWVAIIFGLGGLFFLDKGFFAVISVSTFIFVFVSFENFTFIKKQHIRHWIFLMTPVVFLLIYLRCRNLDSFLDNYVFTQPHDFLVRWFIDLYIGWLFAAWLTYLLDTAITYSIMREYRERIENVSLDRRWKQLVVGSVKSNIWLDLDTFKKGVCPQAWILHVAKPTKPWRYRGEWEPLCFSYLMETDCSEKASRLLDDVWYVGYGPREIKNLGKLENQKFKKPENLAEERLIDAVCEENKKRGNDFADDITPP